MNEFALLFVLFVMVAVFTVISIAITYRRVHDDSDEIITTEYKPPKGINSAEAGYIYYGWGDMGGNGMKNVISLLPYLASKGYLKISGVQVGQDNMEDDLVYIVKEYNGNNESERLFMDFLKDIAISSDVSGEIGRVSSKSLRSGLVQERNIIDNSIRKKFKDLIFARKFRNYALIWSFYFLVFVLISFPVMYYGLMKLVPDGVSTISVVPVGFGLMSMLILPPVITSFIVNAFVSPTKKVFYSGKKNFVSRLVWIIIGFVFIAPFWIMPAVFWWWSGLWQHIGFVSLYIFGLCCAVAILYCIDKIKMSKTAFGKEQYKKVLGFREYLEKVEKDRIQVLAKEDPEAYYEIMAYAYALNVANDWVNEFEVGIVDNHRSID